MQKKSEEEEDEVWKMKRMRKDRFSLRSNPGSVHSKEEKEKERVEAIIADRVKADEARKR